MASGTQGVMESNSAQRRPCSQSPYLPEPESLSVQYAPSSDSETRHQGRLKLPEISQFTIACYAGFIVLAALYVAHSSANTSADAALLANKIAIAGVSQAQVANQIQLIQLCLLNSVCIPRALLASIISSIVLALIRDVQTLLIDVCGGILAPAASQLPKIVALTMFQYDTAAANGKIEARFVHELMGFHIAFFSLLAFAVIHLILSLRRPVKEYVRSSKEIKSLSRGGAEKRSTTDVSVSQDGAGFPVRTAAEQGGHG